MFCDAALGQHFPGELEGRRRPRLPTRSRDPYHRSHRELEEGPARTPQSECAAVLPVCPQCAWTPENGDKRHVYGRLPAQQPEQTAPDEPVTRQRNPHQADSKAARGFGMKMGMDVRGGDRLVVEEAGRRR